MTLPDNTCPVWVDGRGTISDNTCRKFGAGGTYHEICRCVYLFYLFYNFFFLSRNKDLSFICPVCVGGRGTIFSHSCRKFVNGCMDRELFRCVYYRVLCPMCVRERNKVFHYSRQKLVLCSKQTMRLAETDHMICFSQSHGLLTTKYKFLFTMSKHLMHSEFFRCIR